MHTQTYCIRPDVVLRGVDRGQLTRAATSLLSPPALAHVPDAPLERIAAVNVAHVPAVDTVIQYEVAHELQVPPDSLTSWQRSALYNETTPFQLD